MTDTKYNGWTNYETWNVALWIGNDEGLYHYAKGFKNSGYEAFAHSIGGETPDGVRWDDARLDLQELDDMLGEL